MKIAVLMGGISGERNVSFAGGKAIYNALIRKGHEVIAVDPALGVNSKLDINNFEIKNEIPSKEELSQYSTKNYIDCINSELFDDVDCVFNLVHGVWGEDGHLQALLELRGLKYTGSNIKSSALSMDKIQSKLIISTGGIPTPEWIPVNVNFADDYELMEEIRKILGEKIVIKPYDQGSALGLTIVKDGNLDDISNGIKKVKEVSKIALIEKFIDGRELTVAVIDGKSYPIIEIRPKEGFYDYKNKYTKGQTEYICPAEISNDIEEFILNLAADAANLLGCRDFCRVDFRLDSDGVPHCLEVNTIPGFTELSLLPMAAKQCGIEFDYLCELLVNLALKH